MCLAIPGKILSIQTDSQPLMGIVSFAGISRPVCLDWVPEVETGDYVLVHVGFALNVVDEAEALETLRIMQEAHLIDEELGADSSTDSQPEKETDATS